MHAAQAVQDLAEIEPYLRLVEAAARLAHAPDQALEVSCKIQPAMRMRTLLAQLRCCMPTSFAWRHLVVALLLTMCCCSCFLYQHKQLCPLTYSLLVQIGAERCCCCPQPQRARTAWGPLRDDDQLVAIHKSIKHGDDVWVAELLQQVHFLDAALPLLGRHVCNLNAAYTPFAAASSRQADHCYCGLGVPRW